MFLVAPAKVTHTSSSPSLILQQPQMFQFLSLWSEQKFNKIVIVMDDAMKVKLFVGIYSMKRVGMKTHFERLIKGKIFWQAGQQRTLKRVSVWKENRWLDMKVSMQNKLQNSRVFNGDLFFSHVGSSKIVLPKQNKITWCMRVDDVGRFI